MKCGECKTELVKVVTHVCPKCGNEIQDFTDRIRLEKEKQKYRKKRGKK